MDLTPSEIHGVAENRYWKKNWKAILIGCLIIINILGLCILGLYLTDNRIFESQPLEYSLNATTVTIDRGSVYLDGQEMQSSEVEHNWELPVIGGVAVALFLGFIFYHVRKAKRYGTELLEESITKERADG